MTTTFVLPSIADLSSRSGRKVRLSWESTPKLKGGKSNPMQGLVTKLSTAEVTLSETGLYAKRKVMEGEFKSSDEVKGRKWGVRVGNTCIIEHKGAMYIEIIMEGKPKTTYFLGADEIDKDAVTGLQDRDRDSKVMLSTIKAAGVKILDDLG